MSILALELGHRSSEKFQVSYLTGGFHYTIARGLQKIFIFNLGYSMTQKKLNEYKNISD